MVKDCHSDCVRWIDVLQCRWMDVLWCSAICLSLTAILGNWSILLYSLLWTFLGSWDKRFAWSVRCGCLGGILNSVIRCLTTIVPIQMGCLLLQLSHRDREVLNAVRVRVPMKCQSWRRLEAIISRDVCSGTDPKTAFSSHLTRWARRVPDVEHAAGRKSSFDHELMAQSTSWQAMHLDCSVQSGAIWASFKCPIEELSICNKGYATTEQNVQQR